MAEEEDDGISGGGINVEMHIESPTQSAGGGGARSLWLAARRHLNPGGHSVAENALAAVVILLFVTVIALAATHGGFGPTPGPLDGVCQNDSCLSRAAYLVSFSDRSVSPCEDFYKFACGSAQYVMPMNPTLRERTIIGELARRNEDKLEALLRSPTRRDTPDSYERKLKLFFTKCVDDFLIERIRGSVMALLLRPDFYVMNATSPGRFDLDRMLLSVGKTYGAPAFFQYAVRPNQMDGNKYTISIYTGGIGMSSAMYLFDFYNEQREAYRTYIRSTAQLLVADAEAGSVQDGADVRIEDFVADVMEVETELANITRTYTPADPNKPPLDPANQVSLADMDQAYLPIKWTSFFVQLLEPNAQGSTKVAILEPDYLRRVMSYIGEKIQILHPEHYKRKLSNYMNWQIIRAYTGDLSSSYVHAKREFEATLSSSNYVYESRFDYCFSRISRFMVHGLSSLFVADHFVDSSKSAIDAMYKSLQAELVRSIDSLAWIQADEGQKMKAKVSGIVDKIGYLARDIEDKYLDALYQNFRIESADYLLDMSINWQNFNRLYLGSQLGTRLPKTDWTGSTFSVSVSMTTAGELTVPAGILQWPIFSDQLPGYINYATIGQRMAAELIKSIDSNGMMTDLNGNVNPIWSTRTTANYVDLAKCVNSTFTGLRAGPYVVGNRTYFVDIDPIIATTRALRQILADVDALRLSASVYAAGAGPDLPLPLGHLDNAQAFYVSWAQTFCYTRDPLFSYIRGFLMRVMPEEIYVNGILSLTPGFARAFQCPAGAKMVKQGGGCGSIFYK